MTIKNNTAADTTKDNLSIEQKSSNKEKEITPSPKGKTENDTTTKKPVQSNSVPYKVAVKLLNVRKRATLTSEVKTILKRGTEIEIIARTPQGFGKLADNEGYVAMEYLEQIK